MPLSEAKKKQILQIIDNLLSYHSSVYFDHPIDPVIDQAPKYFEYIQKPMDLGTIRKKIERNEYDNVASFIADVELVWSNAIVFNTKNSYMYLLVRYLQAKFKEQAEFLSEDIRKDWINQMNDLKNKVNNIISNPPQVICKEIGTPRIKSHFSTPSLISSASTSSISTTSYLAESSDSISSSYSTTNISTHTNNRSTSSKTRESSSSSSRSRRKFSSNFSDNDDGEDAENSNQRNDRKTDNIYYGYDVDDGSDNDDDDEETVSSRWNKKSSRSSNKKNSKKTQSKPPSSQKKQSSSSSKKTSSLSSTTSSSRSSKTKSDPDLTEDEIEKLANDVNQLAADDDKNAEIADLLLKMEPQLSFDEEVGVEKLSMPTLKSLKKLVDRLMQV